MSKSNDDLNMSKASKNSKSQNMSECGSVLSTGSTPDLTSAATSTSASTSPSNSTSTDGNKKIAPSNASKSKKSSKKKSKSADKASNKNKSKSKPKNHKSVSSDSKQKQAKAKSKKKSADGKKKSVDGKKSKKKSSKSAPTSAKSRDAKDKKQIFSKVRMIETSKGAVAVNSEKAIESAGYIVKAVAPLYTSDYSTVIGAETKKAGGTSGGQLVVKVITLTECPPRARINLLKNAVRIMRYVGSGGSEKKSKSRKGSLSPVFVSVAEIFLVGTVKLFIFMQYCPGRSVYDWVKTQRKNGGLDTGDQKSKEATQTMIRDWFKALVKGVNELQRIGVAHRSVKLQHILLDESNKPKLIGWSKAVFVYKLDPTTSKTSILKQKKERRVRSNLHLPPEAFESPYNPAPADVWSMGVALVAMSTSSYPFNVRDKKTKFSAQWRSFIKSHMMNTFARNLCHRIFVLDPKERITAANLLKEKYFQAPVKMLTEVSCKLGDSSNLAIKEDSRVGGMSAIENVQETSPKDKASGVEEVAAGGEDEAAAGYEGGAVGMEEENLPPAEAEEECHLSQMNAPEEAEAEAMPEDGEEVEAPVEGEEEATEGEEEGAEE